MKTVALIGDSHTWGQGTAGAIAWFERSAWPVQAGELRLMPFCFGSYGNRIRDYFLRTTPSFAWEEQGTVRLPATVRARGERLRFQLAAREYPSPLCIYCEEDIVWQETLQTEGTPYPVCTVTLCCKPGQCFRLEGQGNLLRVEHYAGEIAVVNCGIGSCPTFRYLSDFWPRYISPLHADIALIEPCTINDWLSGITPEEYERYTREVFIQARGEQMQPIMLSASPIGGQQQLPQCAAPYQAFIAAAYRAADREKVPVADAYAAMQAELQGLTETEKQAKLFDDPWHPNDLGHEIYARLAVEKIKAYL